MKFIDTLDDLTIKLEESFNLHGTLEPIKKVMRDSHTETIVNPTKLYILDCIKFGNEMSDGLN